MEDGEKKETEAEKTESIEFHFQKSNFFRVIKIHGAWGGLTPRSEIQMNIFSERLPLPDSMTHAVNEAGGLGEIINSTGTTSGLVREVEATITMTPDVARVLAEWLLRKVKQFEDLAIEETTEEALVGAEEYEYELDNNKERRRSDS